MAVNLGTAAGTDIPIDHLDYSYIGQCNNSSEVEKILTVLRSRNEGYYPDLIDVTEKRLQELKPNSKLLITDQKIKRAAELSTEQWRELKSDIDQWENVIAQEESEIKDKMEEDTNCIPPVRTTVTINSKNISTTHSQSIPNHIKSTDFAACDKYDDTEVRGEEEVKKKGKNSVSSELSERETKLSDSEKQRLSEREREKGNEAFRSSDYDEALVYYTRSIKLYPSAAAYNNRALTSLKVGKYIEAITDCQEALKKEPNNTKAFLRRATARDALKQHKEAIEDLEIVLKLDPNNKRAQDLLNKVKKEEAPGNKDETKGAAKAKKGKRIIIEEVDDQTGSDKKEEAPVEEVKNTADHAPLTHPPVDHTPLPPPPLPSHIQSLKDDGNTLFRTGQYGSAAEKYSEGIQQLKAEPHDHTQSLATLLSNRAACHFKNGDCTRCISDATESIKLYPVNLKAFMRRALAYETTEKYRQAYSDYQVALRIDGRVDKAREASSRIKVLLQDQDGNNWKDFLPKNSDADRVTAALLSAVAPPTNHITPPTNATITPTSQSIQSNGPISDNDLVSSADPSSLPVITSMASTSGPDSTNVSQTTPTITSTTSLSGSGQKGATAEFEEFKNKGNLLVKKGDHKGAIECYSHCISLCPLEVAPYTNIALCYLKLNEFASAETSCTTALELDSTNIKGLYRRAIARKSLNKLKEALQDLRTLTKLEPGNNSAIKEEKLVHDLYMKELRGLQAKQQQQDVTEKKKSLPKKSAKKKSPKPDSPPVAKEPQEKPKEVKRKKVSIEEVTDEQEDHEKREESTPVITNGMSGCLADIKPEKLSTSQFIQLWNSLSHSASPYEYANLLLRIPSSSLPQVITNKLEGYTLTGIIAAIDQYIIKEGLFHPAYNILHSVSKVPRFDLVLMFLQDDDKSALKRIFTSLHSTVDLSNDIVIELKDIYKI